MLSFSLENQLKTLLSLIALFLYIPHCGLKSCRRMLASIYFTHIHFSHTNRRYSAVNSKAKKKKNIKKLTAIQKHYRSTALKTNPDRIRPCTLQWQPHDQPVTDEVHTYPSRKAFPRLCNCSSSYEQQSQLHPIHRTVASLSVGRLAQCIHFCMASYALASVRGTTLDLNQLVFPC